MRINSKPATDILKHIGINAGASRCRDIFYLFMLFRNSVVFGRWTGSSESNYNLKARVFLKIRVETSADTDVIPQGDSINRINNWRGNK